MGKMTAAKAKSISEPGQYSAGETLYLAVSKNVGRSWVQRLVINGHRCDIGLGSYKLVSLSEAREAAHENRKLARAGGDPLAAKRRARLPTFREAAIKTYETSKPRWRSDKVAKNWLQQLERHAFKRLGNLRMDAIGREDVLAVLTPIWTSKPETARRVCRHIKQTLAWA